MAGTTPLVPIRSLSRNLRWYRSGRWSAGREGICSNESFVPKLASWRWLSSSTTTATAPSPLFPLSTTDLGLEDSMIRPQLSTIQMLPEIETALQDPTSPASIEALQRAVDIFSSMPEPHVAVLAWIATSQQRTGDYAAALQTLETLEKLVDGNPLAETDLELAKAKTLWLAGDFVKAKNVCDALLEDNANPVLQRSPLHYASARTGQAVTRLCLAESLDDVFSVKDPFSMVVAFLKDHAGFTGARTAAQLNLGVAEAVYAQIVGEAREGADVPLDNAMRAWKQGLTLQQRSKSTTAGTDEVVATMLTTRLQSNLAWGLLRMPRERDRVKRASEFAGDALQTNDKLGAVTQKESLTRALTLVAACYHQTSQAVTAEGLLQSALDGPSVSPFEKLDLREAYSSCANLLSEWDKRERDAERLKQQAIDVDSQLPGPWQGKSGIHSSLWFWTPSLFIR